MAGCGGWREPSFSKDVTLANSQLTQRRAGAANEAIERKLNRRVRRKEELVYFEYLSLRCS